MNTEPLVTVRMAAYNHEKYVERAVLSVVNQSYKNIELIVIDDGSVDQTAYILRSLSNTYGFYFEQQANMGATATYNKILSYHTHGKYVKGCASDDELPADAIAEMVGFMESHPDHGACYGHAYMIDDNSEIIGEMRGSGHSGWIYTDVVLGKAFVPLQTFMWRTDLLKALGPYNENVVTEDIDLFYRVVRATQVGFVNAFVYRYRQHETNLSKNTWRMYQDSKLLTESREFDDPRLRKAFLRRHQLYWFHSLSREHKREAMKYFLAAASFFPSKFFLAGCLNLVGLGSVESGYRRLRRWVYRAWMGRSKI